VRLPNFLIVGAARAGTTSLFYYLKQHPEIGLPDLKEPKYFTSHCVRFPHNGPGDQLVDQHAITSLDAYARLFATLGAYKRTGEASPNYLFYYENTPAAIYEVLGDVPIIIILRNPLRRAFSAYSYLVRDSRETLSFREALAAEEQRLENNWDFIWGYKRGGLYCEQVAAYLDGFSQVKIVLQEELRQHPEQVLKELYEFLGVDATFHASTAVLHNPSGRPTNFLVKWILSRNSGVSQHMREILKAHIPRKILERVSSRFLSRLQLSEEDAAHLAAYFRDDVSRLQELISVDLSEWKESSEGRGLQGWATSRG